MALTRRQKEIYEFVRSFLDREGYAPSLEEIAAHFGLSSVATVHKHIQNLVEKGLLRKSWNRSRLARTRGSGRRSRSGSHFSGAWLPGSRSRRSPSRIQLRSPPTWLQTGPASRFRSRGSRWWRITSWTGTWWCWRVDARPGHGETVVALIQGDEATLKRYHLDGGKVRLIAANPAVRPMEFPAEDVEVQGVVIGLVRRF